MQYYRHITRQSSGQMGAFALCGKNLILVKRQIVKVIIKKRGIFYEKSFIFVVVCVADSLQWDFGKDKDF